MLARQGIDSLKQRFETLWTPLLNKYPRLGQIIANTGWLVADKLVRMGAGVLVGAWMARYLGPQNFGILSYATAFVALFAALSSLGLDSIVKRELIRFPEQTGLFLGSSLAAKLVAGVATYLLLILIVSQTAADRTTFIVCLIVGATLTIAPLLTVDLWFQAHLLSRYTVWVQNSSFILFTLVRIVLIVQKRSLIAFAVTVPAEMLIGNLVLCCLYSRQSHYRFYSSIAKIKSLLKASWPLLFASVVIMIYMRIDQLMLGNMLGNEAVGVYSAALKLSEVWYFIPAVLATSLFPTIVRKKQVDSDSYAKSIQHYFDLNAGLAYALAIPATFLAPTAIHLLYGNQYSGASAILTLHIWASLFVFLGVAREQFFVTEGLLKFSFYTTGLGAVSNILINLVLIPRFGGVGAAIATIISQGVAAYFSTFLYTPSRPAALYLSKAIALPLRVMFGLIRWVRV